MANEAVGDLFLVTIVYRILILFYRFVHCFPERDLLS